MIKGLRISLAEAGKIKIGKLGAVRTSKSGTKYRVPMKHDSIFLTKATRGPEIEPGVRGDLDNDYELMDLAAEAGGGTPSIIDPNTGEVTSPAKLHSIPILLHSDTIDEVFPTNLGWYQHNQIVCSGDGEKATRFELKDKKRTGRDKPWNCIGCPENPLEQSSRNTCKPHGILYCSINVPNRAVAGAIYTWRTTSIISIQRMIASQQQILGMACVLQNLPLWIVLSSVETAHGKAHVMHMELRAKDVLEAQRLALDIATRRNQNARQMSALRESYLALLRAPMDLESEDTEAEVNQEFSPATTQSVEVVRTDDSDYPDPPPADGHASRLKAQLLAKQVKTG